MRIKQVWGLFDKRGVAFHLDGYDREYDSAPAACLVEIGGKHILLRNGYDALWFRYEYLNNSEWTYFFYDSKDQNAYHLDATWLERQFLSKQFGRIVSVPVTPAPDCEEFELVYFRSDGTGFIGPGRYQNDFSWDSLWEWPIDPISESFELMSFLGRLAFDEWNSKQVNQRIDPASLEDEPLEFINGSQEELERITRWICHSGIGKPDHKDKWEVTYYAPHVERNETGGVQDWAFHKFKKLRDLFNLAYQYNSFVGYHWEHTDESTRFRNGFTPAPIEMSFTFPPATKEEQGKAKLELALWLDGKVTEEERQHLLGVSDMP